MELMLKPPAVQPDARIAHGQHILSIGSCFTEHIGNALKELKFSLHQNPSGILFDPASVCSSLQSYIRNQPCTEKDLFSLNELYHSWRHHSRFSGADKEAVVAGINAAQQEAHQFLQKADWLIITLGSSFSYRLQEGVSEGDGGLQESVFGTALYRGVANCHRAPAQWFRKHMLTIEETVAMLDNTLHHLFRFNPGLRVIFTVSPVRHIRDGVVENNRSKARLLEAVHHLVQKFEKLYYFPSYELVIDVLRDYRFYAEDLVHPNYLATDYVLEQFIEGFIHPRSAEAIGEIRKLNIARRHKPVHPSSEAHRKFREAQLEKIKQLQQRYPELDLSEEIKFFTDGTLL
jgi:hypothetical protein